MIITVLHTSRGVVKIRVETCYATGCEVRRYETQDIEPSMALRVGRELISAAEVEARMADVNVNLQGKVG